MRVILEDKNELIDLYLPKEVSGNFWIKDQNKDNLINVTSENGKWIIKSNKV